MKKKFGKQLLFYIVFFTWAFFGLNLNINALELKVSLDDLNPAFVKYVKSIKNGDNAKSKDKNFFGMIPNTIEFKKNYAEDDDVYVEEKQQNSSSLPAKYISDLTPIRSQGNFGSCWACAMASVVEGNFLKMFGDLIEISVPNMIYHLNYDASLNNKYSSDVEEGGLFTLATAYFASGRGSVLSENDVCYDNIFDKSDPEHWSVKKRQFLDTKLVSSNYPAYYLRDVKFIPDPIERNDEMLEIHRNKIKRAIMNFGGVASSFLYDPEYLSEDQKNYYCPEKYWWPNHAIKIVGWDDNYSKTNFKNKPKNNGAFIVQNSWGEDWGENGLFYMSYEDCYAGNNSVAVTDIDDFQEKYLFDRIYQRDYFGMVTASPVGSDELFEAKIFNLRHQCENLTDIGLFVANSEVNCEFYLADLDYENKIIGLGDKIGEKYFEFPGYYTVALDNIKELNKKDNNGKFAIIVKMTSESGDEINLPLELKSLSTATSQAIGYENENFVNINGKWKDIFDIFKDDTGLDIFEVTNLNIKAFTEKVE